MSSSAISPTGSDNMIAPSPVSLEGFTLWFTGLSGSGKTTLAQALAAQLSLLGHAVAVLDGDVLRKSLCAELGYSHADREENIRRLAELAAQLAAEGKVVLVAVIAPYRESRSAVRRRLERYVEIYVNAPLDICVQRDPKGLYARAIAGEIHQFTGISDPYEEPLAPDVECRTDRESVSTCTGNILAAVLQICRPTVTTVRSKKD